uniref:Uncharacterized protein n=1 Tax=Anguilla anguilla TaxID=7936 RepID=A0A0E9Q6X4_ANGAN
MPLRLLRANIYSTSAMDTLYKWLYYHNNTPAYTGPFLFRNVSIIPELVIENE